MRTGFMLVLAAALVWTASLSAAQDGPADKALVQVLPKTDSDLARIQAAGLEVYARLNTPDGEMLVVGAGADELGALEGAELELKVLDPSPEAGRYYVVYRMPRLVGVDWERYGKLLYEDETQAIMRMSPENAEKLAILGAELRAITLKAKPLRPAGEPGAFATAVTPDTLVQEMIDDVDSTTVYQYTGDLSGEWAVTVGGEQYTIATRYTYSGTPIEKATQYVGEHLEALGLEVEYHQWDGATYPNVIGELEGQVSPDSIVIICAHVDDMPPGTTAPGADDNASGTTAVLIAADIMTQYQWHYTVRFALWTGEEQGLLGSEEYAQRSSSLGEAIVGVLNLDMIAYNTSGSNPDIDLHAKSSMPATITLAQLFADVVSAYSLDLDPQIVPNGTGASDHASFWGYGYTAILGIEDFSDFNPYYHSVDDLLENVDMGYYVEFVRACIGTFAHMAGPQPDCSGVEDYVDEEAALPVLTALKPGYPNPAGASAAVRYDIAEPCGVKVRVYDARGRLIRTLADSPHAPGHYEVTWDGETSNGERSSPGVYFCNLATDTGMSYTRKVVLVQ